MITKDSEKNNPQSSNIKPFRSLKNNSFFEYRSKAERFLMQMCECDISIDNYEPFNFKMVNFKDVTKTEIYPGIITESEGLRKFIIISDPLAANKKLIAGIADQLQKSESSRVELTVSNVDVLINSILPKNVDFLYKYAILTHDPEVFNAIKEYLDFVGETTIGILKQKFKNESSIYQLIFHRALRVNWENELLDDNTVVDASPIINSIIKNL